MSLSKLMIYGNGGLGLEIADIARRINPNIELHYINDFKYDNERVFSFDFVLKNRNLFYDFQFAIGVGDLFPRFEVSNKLIDNNLPLATLIDPTSLISPSARIGKGCIVAPRVWIGPNTIIEDYSFINAATIMGHDIHIKKHSIISSSVNIGGNSVIGPLSYVGMSSTIKEKSIVGKGSVLGLGSVLHKSMGDGLLAIGNPARPIQKIDDEFKLF